MHVKDLVAPEDAALLKEIMRPGPRSGQIRTHELAVLTKNGRAVPVTLSVRHLFEHGEYAGIQGICRPAIPDTEKPTLPRTRGD